MAHLACIVVKLFENSADPRGPQEQIEACQNCTLTLTVHGILQDSALINPCTLHRRSSMVSRSSSTPYRSNKTALTWSSNNQWVGNVLSQGGHGWLKLGFDSSENVDFSHTE